MILNTETGDNSVDIDAVKSENNISVEVKNKSHLIISSLYGDGLDGGDVIVGNLNEIYQFRVLGEAKMEGTDAVYKVELMGGNIDGVPSERLHKKCW